MPSIVHSRVHQSQQQWPALALGTRVYKATQDWSRSAARRLAVQAALLPFACSALAVTYPAAAQAAASGNQADSTAWAPVDWHPFWASPFPHSIPQPQTASSSAYSTLVLEYQHHPLRAVAASPDPHGRQLRLIENWLTAHIGLAFQPLPRLEVALVQRLSLAQRGLGTQALVSRRAGSPAALFGDGQLWARILLLRRAGFDWVLLQRWTLPWGAGESWLHGSFTYAPALEWRVTLLPWVQTGARLGVRLRPTARQGRARFGSEAEAQLQWRFRLHAQWALGGALTVLPALAKDEFATATAVQRVRRVPAEVSLDSTVDLGALLLQLGSAVSLPLSAEESNSGGARYAGPPGALWRLWLRVERAW